MKSEFNNAVLQVCEEIRRVLLFLPEDIKQGVDEIRLRSGLPVCLTVSGKVLFVCKNSRVSHTENADCLIATHGDLMQTLLLLCNNSVYMHESEIRQGFVSLPCGNRAGVCGVFNESGMLVSVSSVNIRIARQIFGCAKPLIPYSDGGLLIAGPPCSGKTTILRDLIRLLSDGENGRFQRVAVIDSRGEISGGFKTETFNDLGANTDVIFMQNKALGTQIALRTMFPDIIAFDEIGTEQELEQVTDCFNAGVKIITTAHCNSIGDIMSRSVTRKIIESEAIKNVALLSKKIGALPTVFASREISANVGV